MKKPLILGKTAALNRLLKEAEVYVIYDKNVAWVAQKVMEAVPVKGAFAMNTSEELKTMDSVMALSRQLLEAGATRNALVVAVGGGITTDMAGFAASIYKRGVRYANIPTTLLSQVDAAIGGKTGVNLDGFKNMLGAFHMPEFTLLEADFLRTLPPREFRGGLSEMLKTFLIGDGEAYNQLVSSGKMAQNTDEADKMGLSSVKSAQNTDGLQECILKAASIKAEIVHRDPYEHGERAKLNLGHTFGHAIEHQARLRGDDITHGEAVAMGIIMASRLSEGIGLAPKGLTARLKADFTALGLPTESPYPVKDLLDAMRKDKKATGQRVKFVLPVKPGEVILQEMTPQEAYDRYLHTA